MMSPARPLRVLMTSDAVGGVWSYSLALAAALADKRVEVCLATMGPLPTQAQREAAAGSPNTRLASIDAKLEWMPEPWVDVRRAGGWLLDLAADWRPDIVHLNGYAHAALTWQKPVLVAAHSCVASWWRAVRGEDAPAEWNRYRDEVRRGLAAADCLVAPSRAMLQAIATHHGRPRAAQVIANGIAESHATAPRKEPFVLSAGRLWDEAKNVATLDVAAQRLSWPVYVAGAQCHPDGGTISLRYAYAIGHLPEADMRTWFARASIFALPALYEPFGLSALEAAGAGCALVLGDIASLREIWGDAAIFVPPAEVDALARAIQSLIDDPVRRGEWAARARRHARRFSADRMARHYLRLYERLRGPRTRLSVRSAA
jgi:glycogen(starch) synthase